MNTRDIHFECGKHSILTLQYAGIRPQNPEMASIRLVSDWFGSQLHTSMPIYPHKESDRQKINMLTLAGSTIILDS